MMMAVFDTFTPFILIAFALGMDVFSVSLSIGLMKIRLRKILFFILMVGFLHILMPLSGILLGEMISDRLGVIANIISGWLLIMIGVQMIIATVLEKDMKKYVKYSGLAALALTVSLDSFSVGLSMGMGGISQFVVVLLIGLMSVLLATLGMILSRKGINIFGQYSEAIGGLILLGLGIQMVL